MKRRPRRSTLFPYTTLFRSCRVEECVRHVRFAAPLGPALRALHEVPLLVTRQRAHPARVGTEVLDEGELDRRSEEHTSELQSHVNLVCRLLLEKKKPQAREG